MVSTQADPRIEVKPPRLSGHFKQANVSWKIVFALGTRADSDWYHVAKMDNSPTPTLRTLKIYHPHKDDTLKAAEIDRNVALKLMEQEDEDDRRRTCQHIASGYFTELVYGNIFPPRKNELPIPRAYALFGDLPDLDLNGFVGFAPQNVVSRSVAYRIAAGCLACLDVIHRNGFVHRAVCPEIFGVRIEEGHLEWRDLEDCIVITDLSLCRSYRSKPRLAVPFVGSPKFASPTAHHFQDQLPSDDVISVIYMFINMAFNDLPWKWRSRIETIKANKDQVRTSACFSNLADELQTHYAAIMDEPQIKYDFGIAARTKQMMVNLNRRYKQDDKDAMGWMVTQHDPLWTKKTPELPE